MSDLSALLKRVEAARSVRPILFSGPMVRALLEGRKTQTRRMLKPQPPNWATFCEQPEMYNAEHRWVPSGLWRWSEPEQTPPRPLRQWPVDEDGSHYWLRLPFAVGDVLWVRETWATTIDTAGQSDWPARPHIALKADLVDKAVIWSADGDWEWYDGDGFHSGKSYWKPSIHMPRKFSRLTLEVTGVKVERLQDISEADAIAEGATSKPCPQQWAENAIGWSMDWPESEPREGWRYVCLHSARFAFANLWNRINGEDAWAANPWVVAVSFTVHQQNVDAFLRALQSKPTSTDTSPGGSDADA